ncbi:MAG: 50S ribosomal protein L4 [Candidatus Microgenomates bacterium]|jgi:large subunit ribosomal protein L4
MLKVNQYSAKGTALEPFTLPKDWEQKANAKLLAQAVRVYEESSHIGLAKTKTRGEINRTTKKWYKQKGTGGARHGARSAPIFVGGGKAHGPRAERRILLLPQKMKQNALKLALTVKSRNKEVVVAGGLDTFKKTSQAQSLLNKIDKKNKHFTLVLAKSNLGLKKVVNNLEQIKVTNFINLNAREVLFGGMIILDKAIFTQK